MHIIKLFKRARSESNIITKMQSRWMVIRTAKVNLKHQPYYGGVAWYYLTRKVEEKPAKN